jgi:NAD(P)-dependent dehydrogenase (short-subunit alcohol dehydrogenase family)
VNSRVALVTNGLYEGLALACALALSEAGFAIAVVHRPATKRASTEVDAFEQRLREALAPRGVQLRVDRVDPAVPGAAAQLVETIEAELGPIGALINAEGSSAFPHRDLMDTHEEDWARALSIELVGPLALVRACLPGMRRRGWGRIVSFLVQPEYWNNHLLLRCGHPFVHDSWPFLLGKHARAGITRTMWRSERRYGVTLNDVAVSGVRNLPLDALLDATTSSAGETSAGVAEVVRFLCSDPGGLVTGSTLNLVGTPVTYGLGPGRPAPTSQP